MKTKQTKLEYWQELFYDARSKRSELDAKLLRQNELYKGSSRVKDRRGSEKYSKKPAYTYRNLIFELIETQINNGVPAPKITPRDKVNLPLALMTEDYLKAEMDRIKSESINDESERSTLKHGCTFYQIGWDESLSTPKTRGELVIKHYPLLRFYMQPGAKDIQSADYVFTLDLVSVRKLKQLYGVTVEDSPAFRGMNTLVTAWYYNDDGYVSRLGWIENTNVIVFDHDDYESRRILVCKKCGEELFKEKECPVCGSKSRGFVPLKEEEVSEDIIKEDEKGGTVVLLNKGDKLDFYRVGELPFVCRVNISAEDSPYGISDIDILEENQESLNKILTKMEENILKAGAIVTVPKGVNIANTDEVLKIVPIKDPKLASAFGVFPIQANSQQDDILAMRMYEFGRQTLGITDAYQGKRDPTAESGKAKEIAAAQAAGRLESKRRMKDAAYAEIYRLMFKFLLSYCDETRVYTKVDPVGEAVEGSFSRYNFLEGTPGDVYYNDRYNFSVDNASILSTSREALWKETTNNFMAGTFGNPQDPQSLMLFWGVMRDLGYPLAKQALANLQARMQQLPFEMQQAIMQNPEILNAVQKVLEEGGDGNENSKS